MPKISKVGQHSSRLKIEEPLNKDIDSKYLKIRRYLKHDEERDMIRHISTGAARFIPSSMYSKMDPFLEDFIEYNKERQKNSEILSLQQKQFDKLQKINQVFFGNEVFNQVQFKEFNPLYHFVSDVQFIFEEMKAVIDQKLDEENYLYKKNNLSDELLIRLFKEFWTLETINKLTLIEMLDVADVMIRQENEIEKQIFGIMIYKKLTPYITMEYLQNNIEYLFHEKYFENNPKMIKLFSQEVLLPWTFQNKKNLFYILTWNFSMFYEKQYCCEHILEWILNNQQFIQNQFINLNREEQHFNPYQELQKNISLIKQTSKKIYQNQFMNKLLEKMQAMEIDQQIDFEFKMLKDELFLRENKSINNYQQRMDSIQKQINEIEEDNSKSKELNIQSQQNEFNIEEQQFLQLQQIIESKDFDMSIFEGQLKFLQYQEFKIFQNMSNYEKTIRWHYYKQIYPLTHTLYLDVNSIIQQDFWLQKLINEDKQYQSIETFIKLIKLLQTKHYDLCNIEIFVQKYGNQLKDLYEVNFSQNQIPEVLNNRLYRNFMITQYNDNQELKKIFLEKASKMQLHQKIHQGGVLFVNDDMQLHRQLELKRAQRFMLSSSFWNHCLTKIGKSQYQQIISNHNN